MRLAHRNILIAAALILALGGLFALSKAQRWHYEFVRNWKSPDGQYIVNSYRYRFPILEAFVAIYEDEPLLIDLVDTASGDVLEQIDVDGLGLALSIQWDTHECRFSKWREPWELPRPIINLDYAYKPQVRPEPGSSTELPTCLAELGLASLDRTSIGERAPNRYCEKPSPAPSQDQQQAINQLHRNLNPFRQDLAGIASSQGSVIVVFKQGSATLTISDLKDRLNQNTEGIQVQVKERCFSEAQIECARSVIARNNLWRSQDTESLAVLNRKVGDFHVQIRQDQNSAKRLKRLLGQMVDAEVVFRIK